MSGTRLAPVWAWPDRPGTSHGRPPTALCIKVVRDHYETFRAQVDRASDGAGLPRFVREEFEGFLRPFDFAQGGLSNVEGRCGFLAGGFARFHCDSCDLDRLVPFLV